MVGLAGLSNYKNMFDLIIDDEAHFKFLKLFWENF